MNLSLVYSAAIHFLLFLAMFALMQGAPAKKTKAVYTIDFIGMASQPLRYGEPETKPAPAPAKTQEPEIKAPAKQETPPSEIKEVKKEAPKKTAKKEYNSKEKSSAKAKKSKKAAPKK